jgi:hypothetical protein
MAKTSRFDSRYRLVKNEKNGSKPDVDNSEKNGITALNLFWKTNGLWPLA